MSIFSSVKIPNLPYKTFPKSYTNNFTAKMGELKVSSFIECIPGDKVKQRTDCLVRLQPMLAPIYQQIDVYQHFFKVPMRLLMNEEDFAKVFNGGKNGNDFKAIPNINMYELAVLLDDPSGTAFEGLNQGEWNDLFGVGSLWEFLGYPILEFGTDVSTILNNANVYQDLDHSFSLLPLAAYQRIYSDYYKDENLSSYEFEPLHSGSYSPANAPGVDDQAFLDLLTSRSRCWKKDYFTSALPFTQRGTAASVPVSGNITADGAFVFADSDGDTFTGGYLCTSSDGDTVNYNAGAETEAHYNSGLSLNEAEILINDLRAAEATQRLEETSARSGYRLTEWIQGVFGVRNPDARLQRCEYLGGSVQPIVISEVLQNSNSNSGNDSPLGTMGGHGISVNNMRQFKTFVGEYAYVIGITSVVPKPVYYQGVNKMNTRLSRFDFYTPQYAHIGEEAILNKELYFDWSNPETLNNEFGYTPRYSSYKTMLNQIHGDFRGNLLYWINPRTFSDYPALNENFMKVPDLTSAFSVNTGDHYLISCINNINVKSKMSYYGTPY